MLSFINKDILIFNKNIEIYNNLNRNLKILFVLLVLLVISFIVSITTGSINILSGKLFSIVMIPKCYAR